MKIVDYPIQRYSFCFYADLHLRCFYIKCQATIKLRPIGLNQSLESNSELYRFCYTAFCDWSTNLRHQIRGKSPKSIAKWLPAFSRPLKLFMYLLWVLLGSFWMLFFFPIGPVISLVLDFKSSSEPRTLLKDILTKKLSEKTFTQVFTF